MNTDKVKATIRAMLNLAANDAASQGEIDNAMRFAAKLMEQHQLSDADLSEVDDKLVDLERAEMDRQWAHSSAATLPFWEGQAAMFAAALVGGVKLYKESASIVRNAAGIVKTDLYGNALRRPAIVFYGIAEDVELARQVYGELCLTIASLARLKWGSVYRGDGRSYCEGFVAGLHSQLKRDNSQALLAAQQSGTTALVAMESRNAIIAKKTQLADKWLRGECGVNVGGARSTRRSQSGDAYGQGKTDGASHNASADRRRKICR